MNIPGYDAWRLSGHDDDRNEIGTEDGQPCNRFPPDDEDMGRARPRRCTGTMETDQCSCCVRCNICGEYGMT